MPQQNISFTNWENIPYSPEVAEDFLLELPNSYLVEHLRDIIQNEKKLEDVLAFSYTHQLGFEKYLIYQTSSGIWIRLHYWPKGESNHLSQNEDIHSHCAAFSSKILSGELHNHIYSLDQGKEYKYYSYTFDKGKSYFSNKGFFGAIEQESKIYKINSIYSINDSTLHKVTGTKDKTLTLSIWDKRQCNADILRNVSLDDPEETPTTPISKENLIRRFQYFIQELS